MKTQEKTCTWTIKALWKNKALDYTKVPLLDTVFYDLATSSYQW